MKEDPYDPESIEEAMALDADAKSSGRREERLAIVEWLKHRGYVAASVTAEQILRGEHLR